MNDDAPLFVPEEFEREHIDDARRRVASAAREPSGARRVVRRLLSRALPTDAGPARRYIGLAVVVHAVVALLLLGVTVVARTWIVGLVMAGTVLVSLAVAVILIRRFHPRGGSGAGPPA